jgi:hypothetical protein
LLCQVAAKSLRLRSRQLLAAMLAQVMDMVGLKGEPVKMPKIQSRQPVNTVDATFIRGKIPADIGKEALSMWPAEIEVDVPEDWKEGEEVPAQGPHGRILFKLPEGSQAGTKQKFGLKPSTDFRVEIPEGFGEGMSMTLERDDGTRISIAVPKGKKAGDTFEVIPPAAMVLVPDDVQAGEIVCFPLPGPPTKQWFSAQVPNELILGRYFAARLPPPDSAAGKGMTGEGLPSPTAASVTTSEGQTGSDESPGHSSDSDAL